MLTYLNLFPVRQFSSCSAAYSACFCGSKKLASILFQIDARRCENIGIGHFILGVFEILGLHIAFFHKRIQAIMNRTQTYATALRNYPLEFLSFSSSLISLMDNSWFIEKFRLPHGMEILPCRSSVFIQ